MNKNRRPYIFNIKSARRKLTLKFLQLLARLSTVLYYFVYPARLFPPCSLYLKQKKSGDSFSFPTEKIFTPTDLPHVLYF